MKLLMSLMMLVSATSVMAKNHRLYKFEKNLQKQHIVVYDVKLNNDCEVQAVKNPVDVYWLMNGRTRKELSAKERKSYFGPTVHAVTRHDVKYTIPPLQAFDGIKNKDMTIEVYRKNGKCIVENWVELGNKHGTMDLKKAFAKISLFPKGIKYVILTGIDQKTGKSKNVRYNVNRKEAFAEAFDESLLLNR